MTEQALKKMLAYYDKQLKRTNRPYGYYKTKRRKDTARFKKALSRCYDKMLHFYWSKVEILHQLEYEFKYDLSKYFTNPTK